MKIRLNSSLFHVTQPCTYWVFDGFLENLVTSEMEYLEESANEVIDLKEAGQLWLAGLSGKYFNGEIASTAIKRKDLPKDHPEYVCEEDVYIDHNKAVEELAKCWLDALERWIEQRYSYLDRENKIRLAYKGVSSPREYNFSHDSGKFMLEIPKSEMNYIIKSCLVDDRDNFKAYLIKVHSSYDGYISWVSNDITEHDLWWKKFKRKADLSELHIEHLIWVCLDYWLFGMVNMSSSGDDMRSKNTCLVEWRFGCNQDEFENSLWDNVIDADGNGAFNRCMEYTPIEQEEEVA